MNEWFINDTNAFKTVTNQLKTMLELEDQAHQRPMKKWKESKKKIIANRRITIRKVAEEVISYGSCEVIFTDVLGTRRVAVMFVPKLLNFQQKQHRKEISEQMINEVSNDSTFLQCIITGDESWVYSYDIETKALSFQWKLPSEPSLKKARQVQSDVKVLLPVFFYYHGIVFH